MKSPVYYIVLITLLVILIVILVLLIRKRKREEENMRIYMERMEKLRAERKAEEEKKKTHYTTYNETEQRATKWRHGRTYIDDDREIPKYAAGDDMDRLRRPTRNYNGDILYVAAVVVILVCIKILTRLR